MTTDESNLEEHLREQLRGSSGFFWHRLRSEVVAGHLRSSGVRTVLDLGAGAGLFGDYLALHDPQISYHYIEPLESLNRALISRFGAGSDASGAPDYQAFDAVVLLDVLEHQADDRAFLRELFAKSRPGALLVLTVPALQALWSPWDVALGHIKRYDKKALLHAFEGLPVRFLELSYLFPEMVPLGLYRRLKLRGRTLEGVDELNFPRLPKPINEALYWAGKASLRLRRLAPVGTSVLAALRIKQPASAI